MKGNFDRGVYTEYDRNFNSIYIKVNPTTTKSGIGMSKSVTNESLFSNLAIFDIDKNKLIHFFDKDDKRIILDFLYEKSYNKEHRQMMLNTHSSRIVNNVDLERRDAADKLFIFIQNVDTKIFEIWTSTRLGEDRKLLKSYRGKTDWKLDVYNQKLFFFQKLKNEVAVESIDW